LDYEDYRIPKDTRVVYSIYLTQRHPDFWTEPNRFDPDRFKVGIPQVPYTWLAFGGGPRNCIGAAFGQIEAKLVVGAILSKFDLELVERNVFPHMGATLEPHPGVRMRVHRKPSG
jgi:cytochrome P450